MYDAAVIFLEKSFFHPWIRTEIYWVRRENNEVISFTFFRDGLKRRMCALLISTPLRKNESFSLVQINVFLMKW